MIWSPLFGGGLRASRSVMTRRRLSSRWSLSCQNDCSSSVLSACIERVAPALDWDDKLVTRTAALVNEIAQQVALMPTNRIDACFREKILIEFWIYVC